MMFILDKLKTYFALFSQSQKKPNDGKKDYIADFEKFHRNGMSDEEWEARKRAHPGLFSEPIVDYVYKTRNPSLFSLIFGKK